MKKKAIIIDIGADSIRIGYTSDTRPRFVLPTPDLIMDSYWGGIEDWSALKAFLTQVVKQHFSNNSQRFPVISTIPPLSTEEYRKNLINILFNVFNASAVLLHLSATFMLHAMEKPTAIVVDIGQSRTQYIPVYNGHPITYGIRNSRIGGEKITMQLTRLLVTRGYRFNYPEDKAILRDIKEKLCYIALKPENDLKLAEKRQGMEKQYTLPNGTTIKLSSERFSAPEVIFNPSLLGTSEFPIHETIYEAIMACPREFRSDLYKNIILSGGSSLLPGFKERIHKELNDMVSPEIEIQVKAPIERHYFSWNSASRVANFLFSQDNKLEEIWITPDAYEQEGNDIIEKSLTNLLQILFGDLVNDEDEVNHDITFITITFEQKRILEEIFKMLKRFKGLDAELSHIQALDIILKDVRNMYKQ